MVLKLLTPDVIMSLPLKTLPTIPGISEHIPKDTLEFLEQLDPNVTLKDVPLPSLIGHAVKVIQHRQNNIAADSGAAQMPIPSGLFSSCECGKSTYHSIEEVRLVP